MTKQALRGASAIAFMLALSACGGGGGVNSTPTPTPAPTPTPTPTPTPSANADLVAPLVSETFVNNAVAGTASFPANGAGTATAAKSALTFRYDASSNRYSVSAADRSQNFAVSSRDAALSNADLDVYVDKSGNRTDTLAVRKNAAEKGTPDSPQFQYAGAAVWQRTTANSSAVSATADAFTYGVETKASAMPLGGTATFVASLNGIATYADTALGLKGGGTLNIDFASGGLTGNGDFSTYGTDGGKVDTSNWYASARIASGSNAFSGSFTIGAPSNPAGSFDGRFYGPNHEELGAAWSWNTPTGGRAYLGTLLGRDLATLPANGGLDALRVNEAFETTGMQAQYILTSPTNSYMQRITSLTTPPVTMRYSEDSDSLVVNQFAVVSDVALTDAIRDAAASNASFDVYRTTKTETFGGVASEYPIEIRVLKPGAGNPTIALTYTSFATWSVGPVPSLYQSDVNETVLAYGRKTPDGAMPRSGSASYAAIIQGITTVPVSASATQRPYVITGDASLSYDFAAARMSGVMRPVATDRDSGQRYELGAQNFAGSSIVGSSSFSGQFEKEMTIRGIGTTNGSINGQFTGPQAQEFFARWNYGMIDPVNGGTLNMGGVMVGKQTQ
ncbi:transferrin-binding protein-like solute binding protein [Sphingobium yanoikuyae]|nr:transferrin-binding protein-like solute binding protein [Sphingobium yanoikuyae]